MLRKKIEKIIVKYFSRSASIEELMGLTIWLEKKSNILIFKDYVKLNYLIDTHMLDFETEKEKEKILKLIHRIDKKNKKKVYIKLFKYVAILVTIVSVGYYLKNENVLSNIPPNKPTVAEIEVQTGRTKTTLTLDNGAVIVLEKNKQVTLNKGYVKGEKLVYDTKTLTKEKTLKFNYLTIPKGGQFFVQLSDQTRVWLNSESKLKYPVNFIKGQARMVELVYGEAYFDVSESIYHNGDVFKVKTKEQEIEVLGTEFNIKAYRDEPDIVTTLVEGKVLVGIGNENRILRPLQQSIINNKIQLFTIKKVPKLFDEIAWKNGFFSFKHQSLKEIMKTLSRWYDITFVFKNKELEKLKFTGVLDRENTIGEILIYLQKTNEINFKINKNIVIIE